uniref:non-specific serine/threonine protein kinase n=1 Tax=Kalanchoe fedtschenkoi TaxID=63787 RepID=A0A7N0REY2_KALFE
MLSSAQFQLGFLLVVALSCSSAAAQSRVPQDEVDALARVVKTLGNVYWRFNSSACRVESFGVTPDPPADAETNVTCDCSFPGNVCHVTSIVFKRHNLPGILPSELVNLPYIRTIDLAYNYLNGTIPKEWASLPLQLIGLLANRLSGEIPAELGNITTLTYLDLEANQLSGAIPRALGKLINLETLMLSSNHLTGTLPIELGALQNLRNVRINDNMFSGQIPDYIQNWKNLTRLEMIASGLRGPIPTSISALERLTDLRISDISADTPAREFPPLNNITGLTRILLRNCNLTGEIPSYIWGFNRLRVLDLSFNRLIGTLPTTITASSIVFIFLSNNLLNGDIPQAMLKAGTNVDLSYNNLKWQSPQQPVCQNNLGLNLNLYRSFSGEPGLKGIIPCLENFKCPRRWYNMYINSGGPKIRQNNRPTYEADDVLAGGAANFYLSSTSAANWGVSSSGDFMDDNNFLNTRYIASHSSPSLLSELYTTARISPLSLTYYRYCMINGSYTVNLHFAELQFTNDSTFASLGKRAFDIYIQNVLVEKDFNIEAEAGGVLKPVIKAYNATVTSELLEIRFCWSGRGTTRIPSRGTYGPLVSAVAADPNFVPPKDGNGISDVVFILIGVIGGLFILLLVLGFAWWSRRAKRLKGKQQGLGGLDVQTGLFTLKQIKAATDNFDPANKIGEGGFGAVFKGVLTDGTVIAVKQLSAKSTQGNREFLNEIGMISCLQHPNLVKLHGCCIEGDQLLLVYEYLEHNSLSRALFGLENCQLFLDWPTRHRICLGIARGLAYLHEESRLKIVHRDIKGTNVLLDRNLNPKISDFGLAKLHEEEKTHISTRVAGTIGYMAPEYALWGYLSYKADVYSFGIVALEIVSGKHNMDYQPEYDCTCLLDWACQLKRTGKPTLLVDEKLGSNFNKEEVGRMIRVALLCTNASPSLRPNMSEVVSMLEGAAEIPDVVPESSGYGEDLRFKALRDHHKQMQSQTSLSLGDSSVSLSSAPAVKGDSSVSVETTQDLYDVSMKAYLEARTDERRRSEVELQHAESWEVEHDLYEIDLESRRQDSEMNKAV